jgi:hypothetical protein
MTSTTINWLDQDSVAALAPEFRNLVSYWPGFGYGFHHAVDGDDRLTVSFMACEGDEEFFVGLLSNEGQEFRELRTDSETEAVAHFRKLMAIYNA